MLLSLHKSNFISFNEFIESKERRKWRKTSDELNRKGGESNNYKSNMKRRRERIKLEERGEREQEREEENRKQRRIYENKTEPARKKLQERNKAAMRAAEQERKRLEWAKKLERDATQQQHQDAIRAVTF